MQVQALLACAAVAAACNLTLAAAEQTGTPPGWTATPNVGSQYQLAYEPQIGAYCVYSLAEPGKAVGGFSQTIAAAPYHGKNVVFSAEVREEGLEGSAELFLRSQAGGTGRSGAGWRNAAEWSRVQVQIGAPLSDKVETLDFGILLQGKGRICLRNAQLEGTVAKPAKADNMPLHNEVAIAAPKPAADNLAVRP
ncbi:hypothetical protein [Chitinimonas sp.]|uniref:hypothetical protein n=1 Tax=Chitinimonas sp. TaxID=1934313 RepID=UPI002F95CD4F